ncbi:MAG: hypothetical protein DHS20C17_29390 [Cyclobacteriaceae bacterium]|nr:MAG: hypothetical protein DHS20C17_29390 [Cyclobacteriaceae bacterium]
MLKAYFLRRIMLFVCLTSFLLTVPNGCAKQDANTVRVVKPKGKKKPYNPKKHKKRKRTKTVKMDN